MCLSKGRFADAEAILKNAKKRFTMKRSCQVKCTRITRCKVIFYVHTQRFSRNLIRGVKSRFPKIEGSLLSFMHVASAGVMLL